jgi:hypothetical protein
MMERFAKVFCELHSNNNNDNTYHVLDGVFGGGGLFV